jgi:ABC-type Co2+ transport system permease subunit
MPSTAVPENHEIDVRCIGSADYTSAIFTVIASPGQTIEPANQAPGPLPGQSNPPPAPQFNLPPEIPPGQSGPVPPGQSGPVPPDQSGPVPPDQLKRAYLTTEVPPSPIRVFNDPVQLLLGVLLAGLLVLVVAFPAEFFNSTFENNREEINSWFHRMPRLPRLNLPSWVHLDILGLVAAVLLLLAVVPPDYIGLDEATLAQAIGFLLTIPLVGVILEMPARLYSSTRLRQRKQRKPQWRVVPVALIVAGLLAILSRLGRFDPPYVYGLIAVYIGADQALKNLSEREQNAEQGRSTLIGMLCLFAASVVAWLTWVPLNHAFYEGLEGFGWLTLDAFLVTFFVTGIEAAVFGMIPLTFLKGQEVWRWKRAVWVGLFLPIAIFFVNIELAVRKEKELTSAEITKAVILFVIFGILSMAFWAYFHPRVRKWRSRVQRWFSSGLAPR